jgi:hypothetical protein
MSGRFLAMPLLVANMGGEMVYILEQRLRAQSITNTKAAKGAFPAQLLPPCPTVPSRSPVRRAQGHVL